MHKRALDIYARLSSVEPLTKDMKEEKSYVEKFIVNYGMVQNKKITIN